ncbi:MAG: hypothetical protein ACPGUV_02410 [Polyangiales bacterium]
MRRLGVGGAACFALLFVAAAAWRAWVSDDAFITFRTIDNALHGHGLVWNVGERVQAYTHPLWMLLVWAASWPHGHVFGASLGVAALCNLALLWGLWRTAQGPAHAALAWALLFSSRAILDYATSGLENPLVHLLLLGHIGLCARPDPQGRWSLWRGVLSCALLWTRLDLVFLALPPLIVACQRDGWPKPKELALGFAPVVLWQLWATFYYGLPIPNSALAKLTAHMPRAELLERGVFYLFTSLRWDPITCLTLAALPVLAWRLPGRVERSFAWAALAQLAWVMWVGGDFMAGRFLTPPAVVAIVLLSRTPLPRRLAWSAATLAAVLTLAIPTLCPFLERDYGRAWHAAINEHGVADERHFYLESTSLRYIVEHDVDWRANLTTWQQDSIHDWHKDEWIAKLERLQVARTRDDWPPRSAQQASTLRPVLLRGAIGMLGYGTQDRVDFIDFHGLGDALLSHLPALRHDPVLAAAIPHLSPLGWRTGHYIRAIPRGYAASVSHDENRITDPELHAFYGHVRTMTRAPLFSSRRLGAIAAVWWAHLRRTVPHDPHVAPHTETRALDQP